MVEKTSKKSFPRHRARRAALMAMFAHQIGGENALESLIEMILSYEELQDSVIEFFKELLQASLLREELADSIIDEVAENWEINRISAVDRNILRIGIAEFIDFPKISSNVTIDEAIELAKEFGSAQSSKFVNGILDAAMRKLKKLDITK